MHRVPLASLCLPAGQSESTQSSCTGGLENLSGLFLHTKGLWFGEAGHECCGISSKLAGSVGLEAGTSSTPDPPPCPEEFYFLLKDLGVRARLCPGEGPG